MKKIKNQAKKMITIFAVSVVSLFVFIFVNNSSASAASAIRITELHYDPLGSAGLGNDKEFIEIYNGSDKTVNLSGWSMVGVDFVFPSGSSLPAYSYGIIVHTSGIYGGRVFGEYAGKLDGSEVDRGETVEIRNASGNRVSGVTYSVSAPWPSSPENGGPSLGLIRTNANEALAACWAPSSNVGGTPGYANSVQSGYGASCSNKAYPSSSSGGGSGGTTGGAAVDSAQTTQAEAVKKKKAEEAKKKKAAAKKKQAEEAKQQEEAEARIQEQEESRKRERNTKVIASSGIAVVSLAGAGGYVWHRKLTHKKKFNEVSKKLGEKLSKKK